MNIGGSRGHPLATTSMLFLALLSGCKSWQPVMEAPDAWIARESPREVRLTAETGARVIVRNPLVANDSIISSAPVATGPFAPPRPGVLASDVREIEVPRFDAVKTATLGASILAVSVAWARTVASGGGGRQGPDEPVLKLAPGLTLMWRVLP